MLDIEELLVKITHSDNARSFQKEIGPSEIGGCRRRLWYRLRQQPHTNATPYRLSAFMGTAIHKAIESRLKYEQDYSTELELQGKYNNTVIKGHLDCYDVKNATVIDWKTITKAKRRKFPTSAQRFQVQLYGWLLQQNNLPCEYVSLVGICRDGNEDDVVIHVEPYSDLIVYTAFAWLDEALNDEMPPADCDARYFCSKYCSYFDASGAVGCQGKR